jgi:hypothetical protein
MKNGIHESLKSLAVDINSLEQLEGNPRKGDIDAIAASYQEFGQVKPIVARKNDDGTITVIAGNHQLQAAKRLGWEEIACIFLEGDDKRAIAYALADNRTMELGYTDDDLLNNLLSTVSDDYITLWDNLGWDEFEIAAIDERATIREVENSTGGAYIAPTIVNPLTTQQQQDYKEELRSLVEVDENDDSKIVANPNHDQKEIAIKGAAAAMPNAAPQAIVQYTIVFDTPEQQSRWYNFVRWLRGNPSIDGNTTAERLMNFIGEHCEV